MLTIEKYILVNTKTVTNPDFLTPQDLYVNITPYFRSLISEHNRYQCEIEYRILLAKNFEDDICSAMTFNYLIKGMYKSEVNIKNDILKEMTHIIYDAIDYHCYMVNIDPSMVRENRYS